MLVIVSKYPKSLKLTNTVFVLIKKVIVAVFNAPRSKVLF